MQQLDIDRRFCRSGTPFEEIGGALQKLRLPLRDLGGVHIEVGGQFRQRLVALDGDRCDLGPESRSVITARSSAHVILHVAGAYHAPIKRETHISDCSDWRGQLLPRLTASLKDQIVLTCPVPWFKIKMMVKIF